jgi:hypothetical protein
LVSITAMALMHRPSPSAAYLPGCFSLEHAIWTTTAVQFEFREGPK